MIRKKKNVKKGIQFCLMVCGASGTGTFPIAAPPATLTISVTLSNIRPPGRTTFVNTLCGKTVLSHKDSDDPSSTHVEEGVRIKPVTVGTQAHNAELPSTEANIKQSSSWTRRGRASR